MADYLSRCPAMNLDEEVNHEVFEEKIFHTMGPEDLYERIGDQQLQDGTVRTVLEQLRRGDVALGQFKRVSSRLGIIGGILHFQSRVVVPAHLRRETIEASHCQHHFGQAATLDSLRKHFFWPHMTREVKAFCRSCLACQRSKYDNSGREPMCPMRLGEGAPGEAVAMDIGTLPWTDSQGEGHRYFLLMVDLFSRYVELEPLKDQEASSLLRAFEQGWVYRGHGMPSIILTDKGTNVDGQVFREFCRLAGVNKRRTTPYHPQCDGMAERHIGLVKQVIRCLQADRHLPKASWPGLLTEVSFHINGMKNATSRLSPHILTFGREPHST